MSPPTISCARALRDGGIHAIAALDAALAAALVEASAEQAAGLKTTFGALMGEVMEQIINPALRAYPELVPDAATWTTVAMEQATQLAGEKACARTDCAKDSSDGTGPGNDLEALEPREWYAVKGLFRWYFKHNGKTTRVEERVVLQLAESFDHALDLAEAQATEYCAEDETANYRIEPMGWWNAYWVGQKSFTTGTEVYSRLMRTSLSAEAFMKRYHPKSQNSG